MKKLFLIFLLLFNLCYGQTYSFRSLDWEFIRLNQTTPTKLYYLYKNSIIMTVQEPNLNIFFIERNGLFNIKSNSLRINYTSVTNPASTSASDLRANILALINDVGTAEIFIDDTFNATLTGAVDGVNTLFTVSDGQYSKLNVFLNGQLLIKDLDYTETSPGSGTFTFTTPPDSTGVIDIITAVYQ